MERMINVSKGSFNYDSGEYENIERNGFSIDRGKYVYNWDDSRISSRGERTSLERK